MNIYLSLKDMDKRVLFSVLRVKRLRAANWQESVPQGRRADFTRTGSDEKSN